MATSRLSARVKASKLYLDEMRLISGKVTEVKMSTIPLIMFPYSGYTNRRERRRLFWKVVDLARQVLKPAEPVVVVNRDTEAADFRGDPRSSSLDVQSVWSVDTCQMWLHGWGHILDHYPDFERVVLLPGDVDAVQDEQRFFGTLKTFLAADGTLDLIVGDFSIEQRFGAKRLIDQYGTYALMANWFPEVTRAILSLPLNRPRSEFVNVRLPVLRELLGKRKFAYEQTLNMIVRSWDFAKGQWAHEVGVLDLGEWQDDSGFRQYGGCLDQIERSERMMKLLWREINEPGSPVTAPGYQDFVEKYHRLSRLSAAIRESATVTIRSLLT